MRAHAKASAECETRKKIDVSQATPCWVLIACVFRDLDELTTK